MKSKTVNTIMAEQCKGPLFIVGMPRSGTKLLRDLLNQHSQISIPEVETHFIPLFIKKYGQDFSSVTSKEEVFADFKKTSFFWNNLKLGNFRPDVFEKEKAGVNSWENFGCLVFTHFGPAKNGAEIIYGDKTPGYINHLLLLKEIFTGARFIHIIRDPRDFCVSVKNIWNKSMFRAADTWNTTLKNTAGLKAGLGNDYLEVKYEDLISNIDNVMRRISMFLGIPFETAMTTLAKTAENYGDAKGVTKILTDNKEKYLKKLTPGEIRKIEEITYSQMVNSGYKPLFAQSAKKLNNVEASILKLSDAFNSIIFHIKEKGLKDGLLYFLKLHKQSSWR